MSERSDSQQLQQLQQLSSKLKSNRNGLTAEECAQLGAEMEAILSASNKGGCEDEKENIATVKWAAHNISEIDTLIFDCDGVLYTSNTPIEGAKQVLHQLRKQNKKMIFLSNNSSKTVDTYQSKFDRLFSLKVSPDEIFTSALAAATYVSTLAEFNGEAKKKSKVFLVGMIGVYTALTQLGLNVIWSQRDIDGLRTMSAADITDLELDKSVCAVVVAMDSGYTYNDTSLAVRYLHETPNVHFVASNDDSTFPAREGVVLAGTGSVVAAIATAAPKAPKVCGKPHKLLFDLIQRRHNIDVKRAMMVGDRLNTDIEFGLKSGLKTLLVMTGVTTEQTLNKSETRPHFVLDSIGNLL